jgi:hypothetical protein
LNYYQSAKNNYTQSLIQQTDTYGSDSEIPVFVVGMPRSGTTLIEQVIASHPGAAGAGELLDIGKIHAHICLRGENSASGTNEALTKTSLTGYANAYLEELKKTREHAIRIVDKMPDSTVSLGLIYKLFPAARIIHAMRNPLDTCLSCYFQAFAGIPETYDMEWLGQRYRVYREAVNHWKALLPEGTILDVSYEQVVQDFETQAHRIIDFCDLPWDDRCLEFYKKSRPIVTASVWQARQPVYTTSSKRWVNYAKYLGPLAEQISDYLDKGDIAELEKHGVMLKRKWGLSLLKRTRKKS